MLVGEPRGVELGLELGVEDLLEDVLEHAVVGLEDGVLGGHVHRVVARQAVAEGGAGEVLDGLAVVVHAHGHAAALGVAGDLELHGRRAVVGGEGDGEGAGAVDLEVGGLVLVAVGVAADDDGLGPAGDEPGDVVHDDGLAEDHAAEDVADGAVGAAPHLLEAELLDAGLVGGDGGALDADVVLGDGVGGVDGDLVVGGVAVLDGEVVVLQVHVQVGVDELVFDLAPDDAGHLVAVEFDDRARDLDLCHEFGTSPSAPRGRCSCRSGSASGPPGPLGEASEP